MIPSTFGMRQVSTRRPHENHGPLAIHASHACRSSRCSHGSTYSGDWSMPKRSPIANESAYRPRSGGHPSARTSAMPANGTTTRRLGSPD